MSNAMHLSAVATIAAVGVYFLTLMYAGHIRHKTGLKAPATVGNAEFERTYRVQMNTLESMPVMLPMLWLATVYYGGPLPAALGFVWSFGRILYMIAYIKAPKRRAPGFGLQMLAQAGLGVLAIYGVALSH
jgi:glutathione S-transferase